MKNIFKQVLRNKKYVVYDSIISKKMSNRILDTLKDSHFPWFLSSSFYTAAEEDIKEASKSHINLKEYLQFVHVFYDNLNGDTRANSPFVQMPVDILQEYMNYTQINSVSLVRCKANFQTQHINNSQSLYNTPHRDLQEPHLVLLYYANDSDGDTVLFDNETEKEFARISPKQGRILAFDGGILHAGSHPYNSECRIVINYNLTSA